MERDPTWKEPTDLLIHRLHLAEEGRRNLTSESSTPSTLHPQRSASSTISVNMMGNLTITSLAESVKIVGTCPCRNDLRTCPFCTSSVPSYCTHGLRTFCRVCRIRAQSYVLSYVRTNTKSPRAAACIHCKSKESLHLHHLTYVYPFSTVTLCRKCHGAAHANGGLPAGSYPSDEFSLRVEFILFRAPAKRDRLKLRRRFYSDVGLRFFNNPSTTESWLHDHKYDGLFEEVKR